MPIWPDSQIVPPRSFITPTGVGQPMGCRAYWGASAAAAWPSANRALYLPIMVETPVLATQILIYVGAAAGNVDVGIYRVDKTRLVSVGSTVVAGTNTPQLLDITDTTLTPGNYWLGMVCSTVTTLTIFRLNPATGLVQGLFGSQQEALGATTLPASATFATISNVYVPVIGILADLLV